MRILLVFLSALLVCGVGDCCAETTDGDKSARIYIDKNYSYDDSKPASLQDERPLAPVRVDAGVLKLTFSGYAQASYIYDDGYVNEGKGVSNSFTVDRLNLMLNAQIIEKIRMFVMFDARSASLNEMYGEYQFLPEIKVRAGLFKQPFMLENITSPTLLNNLQVNPLARFMAGFSLDPGIGKTGGRDIGLQVSGDLFPMADGRRLINYAFGVFNGNFRGPHNTSFKDNNSQKDIVGMVNVLATKQLMFTTSFVVGTGHAIEDRAGVYVKDENYRRRRFCAGFEWTTDPIHLRSEYVYGVDKDTHMQGVYLSADVKLVDNLKFVANYDYLDTGNLGAASHTTYVNNRTHTFVAGLSYTLFKHCRIVSEYTYARPDFGPNTQAWQTQLQVKF